MPKNYFNDLVNTVNKNLGVNVLKAPVTGNDANIERNGYTVAYYLDKEGSKSQEGSGYIVIWYTDSGLRNSINRQNAINKFSLIDSASNGHQKEKETVLVAVIHIQNNKCELSSFGLTSFTDGESDLTKLSYIENTNSKTSLSQKMVFGKVNPNDDNVEEYREDEYIKFGDYVNYDPIHTDVNKTEDVDEELLSYTVGTGTTTEHGIGIESFSQNYTTDGTLTWRVIGVKGNKVEIIPTVTLDSIPMVGTVSYLYAEQELNEICKIYGFGYGADKSVGATYKIGGPLENEEITNTITGTGARSINVDDINRILKIGETVNVQL